MTMRILVGDALEQLGTLPDGKELWSLLQEKREADQITSISGLLRQREPRPEHERFSLHTDS